MTAKNEHTGKLIQSIPSKQYQDNFDAIFRNNPPIPTEECIGCGILTNAIQYVNGISCKQCFTNNNTAYKDTQLLIHPIASPREDKSCKLPTKKELKP
jgi:hypothetical protein